MGAPVACGPRFRKKNTPRLGKNHPKKFENRATHRVAFLFGAKKQSQTRNTKSKKQMNSPRQLNKNQKNIPKSEKRK
jgi:hypothetical protein